MDPIRFLAAVRARLVRALLIEGAARICAIGLIGAVLAVTADYLWRLPGGVRLGLLLGVLVTLGAVAWSRLVRPLRRDLGDAALARFVERRLAVLDGRLLTRIEGIALGAADEAVLTTALAHVAPQTLVPARRTPKQLLITGLALGVVLVAVAAVPSLAWDGARRLLLPLGENQWRRHTSLSAALEKTVVPADGTLVVTINRSHPDARFSAPVVVTWEGGRVLESRQLGGLTGSSWSTSIAAPPGVYRITVASADAEPVELTGRVVSRPTVARITAALTPPAYTGLPKQQADTLAAAVIPGTVIDFALGFRAETGREVVSASARFGNAVVELTRTEAGWTGRLAPRAAGILVIQAADQDGIGLAGDVRFPLTITPDRAPVVSLSGPAARETVTVRAVVVVSAAASDDFGLGELNLAARTLGVESAAASVPEDSPAQIIERFAGVAGQTSVNRAYAVEVGRHAAVGQQLALTARAADRNDVTGPGTAESDPLLLRVVTEDVLRQELDRVLSEAKERVSQGRDDLAAATQADERNRRLRSASQAAGKADELLAQAVRRWNENQLAADGIQAGRAAKQILDDTALPKLAQAGGGDEPARVAADAALAEAERLLSSILQEGDLTRLLTSLIVRQTALNIEARGFVRAFLTKPVDTAGKALQTNLATRQRELADQALDLERRLLAKEGSAWTKAQEVVRKEGPGDRLRQAGQDLATNDRRPKAIENQKTALEGLQRLLDALRGGDAAKDLASQAGQLAKDQEALARELERGSAPGALIPRQRELAERTQALAREAASKDPNAAKLLQGAHAAQDAAQAGMAGGAAAAATRDANAAAGLLREAQKALGGADQQKPADGKQPEKVDIIALLKELRTLQAAMVTDATLLDADLQEKKPDFSAQRQILNLSVTQSDLRLRLSEEAIKPLQANPIAGLALQRVERAMQSSAAHLGTPALGSKGVRLARGALAELARLIEVAEDLPKQGGGGGGGKGQAPQAAFPPQAELALLAAMQADLALRTAAAQPGDLTADQRQLQQFVEVLGRTVRPDTRPAILLERTRRAMASATFQLGQADRGPLTRNEQQAAEAALRRLLAEAGGGGRGGGGSDCGKPSPPSGLQQQQQQPQEGGTPPPGSSPEQSQQAQQGGAKQDPGTSTASTMPVQATTTVGDLLQLPPQIREQLRQAREQSFSPGQLQIYQRYLELLEDGK